MSLRSASSRVLSAAHDMEGEGVPRTVAMQIIGHKTEAMDRRYAIVSEADHREAARKRNGLVSGIVVPLPLKPVAQLCSIPSTDD